MELRAMLLTLQIKIGWGRCQRCHMCAPIVKKAESTKLQCPRQFELSEQA